MGMGFLFGRLQINEDWPDTDRHFSEEKDIVC